MILHTCLFHVMQVGVFFLVFHLSLYYTILYKPVEIAVFWADELMMYFDCRVGLNQPLESATSKFGEHFHDCWAMKKVSDALWCNE